MKSPGRWGIRVNRHIGPLSSDLKIRNPRSSAASAEGTSEVVRVFAVVVPLVQFRVLIFLIVLLEIGRRLR
jgi:hypothetical protein